MPKNIEIHYTLTRLMIVTVKLKFNNKLCCVLIFFFLNEIIPTSVKYCPFYIFFTKNLFTHWILSNYNSSLCSKKQDKKLSSPRKCPECRILGHFVSVRGLDGPWPPIPSRIFLPPILKILPPIPDSTDNTAQNPMRKNISKVFLSETTEGFVSNNGNTVFH